MQPDARKDHRALGFTQSVFEWGLEVGKSQAALRSSTRALNPVRAEYLFYNYLCIFRNNLNSVICVLR
jgi:hypothetical protein